MVWLRDRNLVLVLVALASLAWLITLHQWRTMTCGACYGMSVACPICIGTGKPLLIALGSFLFMWSAMMAAMMLPSATPMVLLFSRVAEQGRRKGTVKWFFIAGYLAAWFATGLIAFAAVKAIQSLLGALPGLSPYNKVFAGGTLLAAGLYQLSPLKNSCLRRCQSPLDFLLEKWRDGNRGAFLMGAHHGLYCIGCCWGLMIVMFAVGLMNLAWMVGLTFVMSIEKLSRHGPWVGRIFGLLLIVGGAFFLYKGPTL
jgi:predicted metal-binding membrane protein